MFCVTDLEAIKRITVTDYDHFLDHRSYIHDPDKTEPLFGKCLVMLTGDRWRDMRTTLTPAFTGSKIRRMFPLVRDCCTRYMRALTADAHRPDHANVVDIKDLTKRYMVDVISSTAFGYQVDSWNERDNITYRTAMSSMHFHSAASLIKLFMFESLPRFARLLGIRLMRPENVQFYHRLVHDTMAHRERHGIVRPDMIHLMAEARQGFLKYEADSRERTANGGGTWDGFPFGADVEAGAEDVHGMQRRFWDEDDVTAQCYLFFFAGAGNTSTLLSFAAQELLENRQLQDRLRAELVEAKANVADGESITYDALMALPFLDMVVLETLRKWPSITCLDRKCVKDYALHLSSGQTVQLRTGDSISIPLHAIQNDPEYYADPERFDPDRFNAQRRSEIMPGTFLSLGQGPRNCIGWRYAMMAAKSFLYHLLTEFTLDVCAESQIPAQLMPSGLMLKVKGGIRLQLTPRFDTENRE